MRVGAVHRYEQRQDARAFDVLEKAQAEPLPFVRALDDAGDVGDDERPMVRQSHDAEVRLECREGIVGDLGPRRRDHRQQRALAGVRLAEQADVGDQFEDQLDPALLACFAGLPFARRLMGGRGEVLVAAPPAAALRDEQRLVGLDHLAEDLTRVRVANLGTCRHGHEHVVAGFARHVLALAMLASFRHPPGVISIIQQRREIGIDLHEHTSALSTVSTVRPSLGHKLFPPKRRGAGASCAGDNLYHRTIDKHLMRNAECGMRN